MDKIINVITELFNKVSATFDFGKDMSVATTIGIIVIGIALIYLVFKFIKKMVGTVLAVILAIAILIGTGFLSASQVKNFLDTTRKDGLPSATEQVTDDFNFKDFVMNNINQSVKSHLENKLGR